MKQQLGRRSLLKTLGLSPIAAPMMGRVAAEQALGASALGVIGPAEYPTGYGGPWSQSSLGEMAWKALQKRREQAGQEYRRSIAYRLGALETNIAACGSWSPSFALSMQRRKDDAREAELDDMRRQLRPQD